MKLYPAALTVCLALILLPASRVAAVTRIHVAPQGNDANAGTPAAFSQAGQSCGRFIEHSSTWRARSAGLRSGGVSASALVPCGPWQAARLQP